MTVSNEPTLQALAEQWASTASEIKRAEEEKARAAGNVSRLQQRLTTLSEALLKRVGPNISTRVFQVAAGEVVLLEHQKPIRLLEIESKDAR